MFYEYCTALNHRNTVRRESEIDLRPTAEERYISMFGYDNSIVEHLEIAKSVQGFKGHFYCKYLYFDIDSDNLEESHQMARDFALLLYNMLGINPKELFISFSGNKGFHIGLHQNLFGGFHPSKDMPGRVNVLAVRVLMECFEVTMQHIQDVAAESYKKTQKRIFNHMDLSIYSPNRIFRVLNSRNAKSGLYKIGLTYQQLSELTIAEIKQLAAVPQPYRFETPPTQIKPLPELQGLWQYALSFNFDDYQNTRIAQGKTASFGGFYAPEEGSRNNDLFKQAAMLFDKSELSEEHVLQLITLINQSSGKPLPYDELGKLVHSAFRRTLPNRRIKERPAKEVEVFQDWLEEWADYYTAEPRPMTCLFPQIDRDQEQNLSGKLACLIGQGGTRKSYFALNILARNILENNLRCMYSSMEMGKVEMVNRLLDMVFPPENGVPASKVARQRLTSEGSAYMTLLKQAAASLEDKLILSNVTNRTATDYLKEYEKVEQLYGPVDILCVDGLSMMGGTGTENERFERHTKELKALCNATGLFIPLICHTTKEAKPYNRDPAPYVRGSGKILDNCDFTIGFSNIIDEHRSSPENIQYINEFAHIKYYNKRGTGLTLNAIYDFSGVTKAVTPSAREPSHYPEYESFTRQYNAKKKKEDKSESGW